MRRSIRNYNANVAFEEAERLFKAIGADKDMLISLIKQNLPELNIKLTGEKISELSPRYENNKSLNKCYGKVDRKAAEEIIAKLFV